MNKIKQSANLDQVLDDYANASQLFDTNILKNFIEKYPEHALALQRYAQVQLTSVSATLEEISNESISDQEMLPRQSKLLQRMQLLRGNTSAPHETQVAQKLATIKGEKAIQAASTALFGTCDHGEDLILLSYIEANSEVSGVPEWFYISLGSYVNINPEWLRASNSSSWRQSAGQRYSAKEKPKETTQLTWEEVVEQCIMDEVVKKAILERSGRK